MTHHYVTVSSWLPLAIGMGVAGLIAGLVTWALLKATRK